MSLAQAQVQFAAEFVTLMATAAALALVLLRAPMRAQADRSNPANPAALVAFAGLALLALAAAAFVHGSLLVSGKRVEWVGLARMVAAGFLIATFPYQGRRRAGPVLLIAGSVLWMAAGAAELASLSEYAADGFLFAGSVLTGAAVVVSAQRSVAARVAGSAAATLLLVVVVLALALSTVISSSVQRQEVNRLASRARVEQATLTDTAPVSASAQLVEADLAGFFSQATSNPLNEFANGTPAQVASAAAAISQRLASLAGTQLTGTLSYSNWSGTLIIVPGESQPIPVGGFPSGAALGPASCSGGRQGLFLINGAILLAASSPECTAAGQPLGVAIASVPLDNFYLSQRRAVDPSASLALVYGGRVVATAGITAGQALQAAQGYAGPSGGLFAQAAGDHFVSVTSVPLNGSPSRLTLVLTSPATTVLSTRQQLFRTLFLIAFGGTVLALGLAIFIGDRITAGIRRLTRAAAAIQRGDNTMRAGVTGEDEVAALGSAFDAMLDSVASQAAALQAAADDEARLRNRLEAVVAGMTDALVAVDPYGRITDFNRAAEALTGVEASRALGAPAEKIVVLRGEDGMPAGRLLFRSGSRDSAMMGHVVRRGEEIPVAVSSGGLRGPGGETSGTVLVFRDMRREHEVEQMKTEFLSRVGHELRTPLTGILGYADILLRRDVPPERARAWYEDILYSGRRLLRIVEMLEFFASEGAGRIVLRPEPVDVRALVNGIASSWSGRLPGNLSLGRRVAKDEALVSADRRWLSLAIDELIDNAVKFSPEGGRIVVKVDSTDEIVQISVSDQGMGMTDEQHDIIFGDFVQGDSSDTRRFGGLGLGLAVVRRVVDGLGGSINCRSAPGRGTTFTIVLPAWPDGRLGEAGAAAQARRRNGAGRSPTRHRAGS